MSIKRNMSDPNIEILKKETLVQAIKNAPGTKLFNSLMVRLKDSGEIQDILNDGEYSCAFFVSSLLYISDLIDKPRVTVDSLERYLKEHATEIDLADAKEGDIVVWEKQTFPDGGVHGHIGFLLGSKEAISTNFRVKHVERHAIDAYERVGKTVYRLVDAKVQ